MRRALLVACVPALASTIAWARLEQDPDRVAFALATGAGLAFGLAVALVPRLGLRRAAFAAVGLAALAAAFLAAPGPGGDWLGEGVRRVARGLEDADAVQSPFVASALPELHALVLLAVFAFSALLALAAAARRPLTATALAVVAVGWPVATLAGDRPVTTGALVLAVALWPTVVLAARSRRGALLGGGVAVLVVAAAAGVAAAGARPSGPAVTWRNWDLFAPPTTADAVTVIWDSNYGGVTFPARKTTVLRIRADREARYWRAATLDLFTGDRWLESPLAVAEVVPRGPLPKDELVPFAAAAPADRVEQEVEVAALVDDHVVAAGHAARIETRDFARLYVSSGGIMRADKPLVEGDTYKVWSHAPSPSPAELLEVEPAAGQALTRYLALDRTAVPPFGEAGREAAVDAIFDDDRYPALWPYRGVWEQAARLSRGMASPYEATVAIERWFRGAGFAYEEHPPPPAGLPPLADFVLRTKQGYCQQFAGAMTLMLRFLGIPSRVAVGFTSGTWKDGVWTVTDREAHAWVEVWFRGYGWLPFDPTPGRGTFSAAYTLASDSADAVAALGTGRFLTTPEFGTVPRSRGVLAGESTPGQGSSSWAWLACGGLVAIVVAIGALKTLPRRRRYATADPRRLAVAARAEVVSFVVDQGVELRRGAGVAEIRVAVERQVGVPAGAFAASFSRARYGPPDEAAAADVRRDAKRLVRAIRARVGLARRARGYFTLRSLRRR